MAILAQQLELHRQLMNQQQAQRFNIELPPNLRFGNAGTRLLGRWGLKTMRWRIEGVVPNEPKLVVALAPHTSNWDFLLAMFTMLAIGIKTHWLAKHSLFRGPFAGILRQLGGIPVQREKKNGWVAQIVNQFDQQPALILALAPEGTRRAVANFRTGFLRIAYQAQVPIVLLSLDYRRRVVGIGQPRVPSGEVEADEQAIREYFAQFTPRHPAYYPHPPSQ